MGLFRRHQKEYIWIKFILPSGKYGILGPFKSEEEAQENAMDELRGVVFDTFHLKTMDKGEASKALSKTQIQGHHNTGMGDSNYRPNPEDKNKIRFM